MIQPENARTEGEDYLTCHAASSTMEKKTSSDIPGELLENAQKTHYQESNHSANSCQTYHSITPTAT